MTKFHLPTRDQLRGARAMLGWTQEDLAKKAGVSLPSIKRIEAGRQLVSVRTDTLLKIQSAIEDAGIEFLFRKNAIGLMKKIKPI